MIDWLRKKVELESRIPILLRSDLKVLEMYINYSKDKVTSAVVTVCSTLYSSSPVFSEGNDEKLLHLLGIDLDLFWRFDCILIIISFLHSPRSSSRPVSQSILSIAMRESEETTEEHRLGTIAKLIWHL